MRKIAIVLVLAALCGAAFADPYLGYCSPAGMQAGSTVRIVIGGQGLDGVRGAVVSGDDVEVIGIEKVPFMPEKDRTGYRDWAIQWMKGILSGYPAKPMLPPADVVRLWPKNDWWERLSELDRTERDIVARGLFTFRDLPDSQKIGALSQQIILDVAASPHAEPGVRELILYDGNGASAPHPFLITMISHATEPGFVPEGLPDEDLEIHETPVVLDGCVHPKETDVFTLRLVGGRRLTCTLTGREFEPYIGDAVPGFFNPVMRLTDINGRELAFADDFHYLPDPVLTVDIPCDGLYCLEIRDNLFRGRPDFVYSVECVQTETDHPQVTSAERAFLCHPCALGDRTGEDAILVPGMRTIHRVEIETPGKWTFDLIARRIGSPLDGVLTLVDAKGRKLAEWDDIEEDVHLGTVPQAECDPRGEWTFAATGTYRVVVSDRTGAGGPDYAYRLRARPRQPSVEVYATPSSFVLNRQGRAAFYLTAIRKDGFEGPVALEETEDFRFENGTIPSGTNETVVTVVAKNRDWRGLKSVDFRAGGVRIVPADPAEQAFAYKHLLPAAHFNFIRPEPPAAAEEPRWPYMPVDRLSPKRVAVPLVVPVPKDADDALVLARLPAARKHILPDAAVPVAVLPTKGPPDAVTCARAVLAGATRFVRMPGLLYDDGDPDRVRIMARAALQRADNDTLLYLPTGRSLMAGAFGRMARALRDGGWCYDCITDEMLTNDLSRIRRAVLFVPESRRRMPEAVFRQLVELAESGMTVLVEGRLPEGRGKGRIVTGGLRYLLAQKTRARREPFAALPGVRFSRFDRGWYFIHNSGMRPVKGPWRFSSARREILVMEVVSGKIRRVSAGSDGSFAFKVEPGESVWVCTRP